MQRGSSPATGVVAARWPGRGGAQQGTGAHYGPSMDRPRPVASMTCGTATLTGSNVAPTPKRCTAASMLISAGAPPPTTSWPVSYIVVGSKLSLIQHQMTLDIVLPIDHGSKM